LFEVDDPTRDWRALDLGATVPDLKTKTRLLGIIEPDLRQFQAAGGKLLIYNGWGDVGVNPYSTIDYYQRLKAASGGSARQFARLFLVPGMFHCGGGLNVDRFDAVTSLIAWVEGGNPPKSIEARRVENGNITRTRLVCAYPQVATYRGRGSTDAAANFVCTSSKP
jgi:feruloyl esterase